MYSVITDNGVKDIYYKRRQIDTIIYLGKQNIGQLFKRDDGSWTVVVLGDVLAWQLRKVDGFRTRQDAMVYCLYAKGIYEPS